MRDALASRIDSLPSGVLFSDESGRVLHANPRAAEILGRPAEALVGARLEEVLAPLDELLRLAGTSGAASGELRPLKDGESTIGFRIGAVPARSDDPARFAIVFQELGPMQRLREERNRLLQLAAVGEVLPAVLHEIKNPLAGITTAVEVLLEEIPEGHVRRELLAVLGEVRRIKLTLEGIGVFRHEIRSRRRSPVHKAVREAFVVIEPQMRAKGIRGLPRIADLPPLPIDAAVVRAFLFNLVSNAIHACSAGDEIAVSLRLLEGGEALELSVADTGCGMPPEVLARCQELFFTTKANGSGIGLALCAHTARESGESLEIRSQEGVGTTVTLRLPLSAAEGGAPGARVDREAGAGGGAGTAGGEGAPA